MKKILYYLAFLLLMLLINTIPTSAKEILTCTRSNTDLKVRDNLINEFNVDDILKTPCVSSDSKVYDFADLLTDSEEDELYLKISDFIKKTNYDLAIVTINENIKGSAEVYADDFYDYNYFGINETRDGLLFLIDMETRELYISTTGYAIKMYDDSRISDILDGGYSYITERQYYDVFKAMILEAKSLFEDGYPSFNDDLLIDESGNPYYIKKIPFVMIFIFASIITGLVASVCYFLTRLKLKAFDTVSYLKEENLNLEKDKYINSFVTTTRRYNDVSNGSSNSSSSGGSFHSSSSGSSHGGGGRHF